MHLINFSITSSTDSRKWGFWELKEKLGRKQSEFDSISSILKLVLWWNNSKSSLRILTQKHLAWFWLWKKKDYNSQNAFFIGLGIKLIYDIELKPWISESRWATTSGFDISQSHRNTNELTNHKCKAITSPTKQDHTEKAFCECE